MHAAGQLIGLRNKGYDLILKGGTLVNVGSIASERLAAARRPCRLRMELAKSA